MPTASNSQNFRRAAFRRSSVLMQWTLHSRSLDNDAADRRSPTPDGTPRLPDHHLHHESPAFQGSGNSCLNHISN
ncbi:hypothetical protein T06_9428 [Trichinella sp. T6]|nr:hypothetical protein T06_9428 [Trichinella sp. T6]